MPKIVEEAQIAFKDIFQRARTFEEFKEKFPIAKKVLLEYVERINSGKLSKDELTIPLKLSRKPSQYKINSYEATVGRELERSGIITSEGKDVKYIILKADADPNFLEKKVIL